MVKTILKHMFDAEATILMGWTATVVANIPILLILSHPIVPPPFLILDGDCHIPFHKIPELQNS